MKKNSSPLHSIAFLVFTSFSLAFTLTACEGGGGGSDKGGLSADDSNSISNREGSSFVLRLDGTAIAPDTVKTGFNGNGHTQTWDGRVFIVADVARSCRNAGNGWVVSIFRPEVMNDLTPEGQKPVFVANGKTAFSDVRSNEAALECDGDTGSGMDGEFRNSIHASPIPTRLGSHKDNPFTSDEKGKPKSDGKYETYELLVYAPDMISNVWPLGRRFARVIVADPKTENARVHKAEFFDPTTKNAGSVFARLRTVGGREIIGIEPTATFDGRLIVYQGDPSGQPGLLNVLMYTWNKNPGDVNGWSEPKSLALIHELEANTTIDEVHFYDLYPIAKKPLKNPSGQKYGSNRVIRGAYPWLSLDGSEVVFTNANAGRIDRDQTLRGAWSILGQATGWLTRHVDGPLNPDRNADHDTPSVRLFFSSPGMIPSVWTPYKELKSLAIPYTSRKWVYPFFGSNTGDYGEINMEDYLDGNYVTLLHMNELVNDDGTHSHNLTADTSGHFANGKLANGAAFPLEATRIDKNPSGFGRGVYMPAQGHVVVDGGNPAFRKIKKGLSLEIMLQPLQNLNRNTTYTIIKKPNSFHLFLTSDGQVHFEVTQKDGKKPKVTTPASLPLNYWSHLAATYLNQDGKSKLQIFVNGAKLLENSFDGESEIASSAEHLNIGSLAGSTGSNGNYIFILDEVKISRVARLDEEIRDSAYVVGVSSLQTQCLPANQIPSFIQAKMPSYLDLKKLCIPRTSILAKEQAELAALLGEDLFNDARLSSNSQLSCGSCHNEALAFTDGAEKSPMANGQMTPRNTPTLTNLAVNPGVKIGWAGGVSTTAEQNGVALLTEMNAKVEDLSKLINSDATYKKEFLALFGSETDASNVLNRVKLILDAYILSEISPDTLVDGEAALPGAGFLSESQIAGQKLFFGKARCAGCHAGPNLTDNQFHNTCFFSSTERTGLGSGALVKTPTLRNLKQTAPYTHTGKFNSLREVIDTYNLGGLHRGDCHPDIRPLGLTEDEKGELQQFLEALSN